jgi:hypothetical protein
MILDGKTNRQIADSEKIGIRAIEDRRRQLFNKMAFRTLPELVTALCKMRWKHSRDWHKPLKKVSWHLKRNDHLAPSLRHHNGKFYVAVQPNNTGLGLQIYLTDDPKGEWKFIQLNEETFDPALLFDDDGKPYVIWSGAWHPEIYIRELPPNSIASPVSGR